MHDGLNRVIDLVEVTTRELTMQSARIKESWGRGAKAAPFVEIVKANCPVLGVALFRFEETH